MKQCNCYKSLDNISRKFSKFAYEVQLETFIVSFFNIVE